MNFFYIYIYIYMSHPYQGMLFTHAAHGVTEMFNKYPSPCQTHKTQKILSNIGQHSISDLNNTLHMVEIHLSPKLRFC